MKQPELSNVIIRQSNIELLRLIIMSMIVVHHGLFGGLGLVGMAEWSETQLVLPNKALVCVWGGVNSFLIIAVNVFVIISGYFSIKLTPQKFLMIIVELLIYTILFRTLYYAIIGNIKYAILSIVNNTYWFVVEYLILMMFAPMLNSYLDRITRNEFKLFIVALLFVSCYLGFIWQGPDNKSGYELFQFVMLYTLGRYISIYKIRLGSFKALLLYVGLSLLTGFFYGLFYVIDLPGLAYRMTNYNSPFIIAASLAFFLLFLNFDFSSIRINKLSKSTLSIYLISGSFLGPIWYKYVASQFLLNGSLGAVVTLLIGLVFFLLLSFLIDPLQRKVNKMIVDKILYIVQNK